MWKKQNEIFRVKEKTIGEEIEAIRKMEKIIEQLKEDAV